VICCFNAEFEALLILGYHGKKGDLCLVKSDSVHHQQERLAEKKAVRFLTRWPRMRLQIWLRVVNLLRFGFRFLFLTSAEWQGSKKITSPFFCYPVGCL